MTDQVIEDFSCTACSCVCDDLRVTVRDGRIVDYQPFCSRVGTWFTQQNSKPFPGATVRGREVHLNDAIADAARILRGSCAPLFYGLSQSSTEGQRAALALADRLGGTVDTTASEEHGPSIQALQQIGESTSSLGEIRNRADLVIYWGSDPIRTHPRHLERYSTKPGMLTPGGRADRTLIVVDVQKTGTTDLADEFLQIEKHRDFEAIWTLRGLLKGIEPAPGTETGLPIGTLRSLAERMKNCRNGVIFFGLGVVRQPTGNRVVQSLLQLVTDLNQRTRFYARRMRAGGDVSGADSVLCWQTGFPFAVNLSRGYPRFCPDEYSASVVLERCEADAAVLIGSTHIDCFSPTALKHLAKIPTILLEHPFGQIPFEPTIRFTTAIYGIHRRGMAYRMDEIPIPLRPLLSSNDPSDGEILTRIQQAMSG